MRTTRLALTVTCCALTVGCSGQTVERPASASVAPPTAVPSPAAVRTPKRVATSETSSRLDFTAPVEGPLDVNSLNPVKMNTEATSGSGFNPFAR